MFILKNTLESEIEKDRPDILVYAIYYNLFSKEELDITKPHIVLFGRKHIGTILRNDGGKWQLFNKKNFPKLYSRIRKKLGKILPKELYDIYEIVYPNKGCFRNYIDPIPESLFSLGLCTTSIFNKSADIDVEDTLSNVVDNIIPTWMTFYVNIEFVRYNSDKNKFEQVSLKRVREAEGYSDFLYAYNYQNFVNYDPDDVDYSIYRSNNNVLL